ncbi:MAG: FtsW/RodA/SpoVE family cell cycle protein [Niameybacter sp.]|uniref:FtsW/RodA/SpoVE family cell cycle protein n=1 Tax=Niameybacter sp. TaxID=2033640 RepID=UPI002FCC6099
MEASKTLTKRKKSPVKHAPDYLLIAMIVLIVGFGVVMVYSASHYHGMTNFGDAFMFAKKQLIFGIVGIAVMMAVTYCFNYRILANIKLATAFYIVSMILVLCAYVFGTEVNGSSRWINLGPIQFQPSEIVKIAVIVMLSSYIMKFRKKMDELKYVIIAFLLVGIPFLLVAKENLSSAIVIGFVGFLIIFISTPKWWYYILLVIGGSVVVGIVYYIAVNNVQFEGPLGEILAPYRLARIRIWQDPWIDPVGGGYQPIQSLYAIGSGGLFGAGLGQGIQKLGFIPEPHNDIIFAVICEELGLVGAALLLLAYGVLVLRGFSVAAHAQDFFGALVASGISGMIAVQVLINVAVNTNTVPTTGMQLPMVSYGGTALLILLGSLGILINISRTASIGKPKE